jgi:RNA polymerase sigma-70 factor, ECF subfamily
MATTWTMKDVRIATVEAMADMPVAQDAIGRDALFTGVAAEFGAPLARLAAAYELDPSRQQDLLQELHFSLWRSLASFENQCSLRTWVYRVAHNTASTYVRGRKRDRRMRLVSLDDLDELVHEADVEHLVDDAAVRGKLKKLIARLKPVDRNVLLLALWAVIGLYSVRRFHGLTVQTSTESSPSSCAASYQKNLERQRDVALSRPWGLALAVPGFVLLLVGYVDSGTPWIFSAILGGVGAFVGIATVIHGQILAGRFQHEIDSLKNLRGG